MSITLTEKAASEVKKIITDQKLEDGTVLRVGVAGGGCSGFQYSLGFDTQFDPKADSTIFTAWAVIPSMPSSPIPTIKTFSAATGPPLQLTAIVDQA